MKQRSSMEIPHGQPFRGYRFAALGVALAFAVLATVVVPSAADAQAGATVEVVMMVSLTSDDEGPIDPRARKIDRRLRREFRYRSLKVIASKTQRLGIDDTATLALPNGNTASVMPMSVDENGVLLAVDIEGAVKVDARAKAGHLLVFGAGRHGDGRLVVSIESRF